MTDTTGLIRYDAMCLAIAECLEVDEAKEIRNRAKAFEVYARQARNVEAERKAAQIRIRAERKAGELLREMKVNHARSQGGRPKKNESQKTTSSSKPELQNFNVTKYESSEWQELAEVPIEDFEAAINKDGPPISTRALIIAHQEKTTGASEYRPKLKDPPDDDAIGIWHLLTDIEPRLFQKSFKDVVNTLEEDSRNDVLRIAPRFAVWLTEKRENK